MAARLGSASCTCTSHWIDHPYHTPPAARRPPTRRVGQHSAGGAWAYRYLLGIDEATRTVAADSSPGVGELHSRAGIPALAAERRQAAISGPHPYQTTPRAVSARFRPIWALLANSGRNPNAVFGHTGEVRPSPVSRHPQNPPDCACLSAHSGTLASAAAVRVSKSRRPECRGK